MPIIIKNLSYSYVSGSILSNTALHDVSLTVSDGEFFGIIGHTGSGKSTLIQHLNGLLQPAAGSVSVDGFDMSEPKARREGRKRVGLVFQYPEYQLFEETLAADIAYGPKNMGLSEEDIALRVDEALRLVGLMPEFFAEKSPFDLSGGEKRRAAIAGVIAMRPRYLVLDEPMAGLDPSGRESILVLLEKLRRQTGCAIIMVSHSMDDIAKCAERVAVMNKGGVARVGTPKEIFAQNDFLNSIGLDSPQMAVLAAKLREKGVRIPQDVYNMDGMLGFLEKRSDVHV